MLKEFLSTLGIRPNREFVGPNNLIEETYFYRDNLKLFEETAQELGPNGIKEKDLTDEPVQIK